MVKKGALCGYGKYAPLWGQGASTAQSWWGQAGGPSIYLK